MAEQAEAGVLPTGQQESGKAAPPFKPRAAEGVETMNRLRDLAAVSARQTGRENMTIPLTGALSYLRKMPKIVLARNHIS